MRNLGYILLIAGIAFTVFVFFWVGITVERLDGDYYNNVLAAEKLHMLLVGLGSSITGAILSLHKSE